MSQEQYYARVVVLVLSCFYSYACGCDPMVWCLKHAKSVRFIMQLAVLWLVVYFHKLIQEH